MQAQLYDNLEPQDTPPDGMGPLAQLLEIARGAHDFVARLVRDLAQRAPPRSSAAHGIRVCVAEELTGRQNAFLDDYFDTPGLSGADARWRSTRRTRSRTCTTRAST